MQLSFFEMVKKGVSTIIEVVDDFARRELVRLENLINNLATVARTGSYNDLTDKPVIPTPPELSEVAYTGEYDDLLNKPALFSGDYNDLTNKPTIPSNTSQLNNDSGFITSSAIPNTSFNASGGWGRQIIGGTAIVATMTASQSVVFDQIYGSDYWKDVTFTIPSDVRLANVINAQATALASSGLVNCTILYVDSSTITIRVSNSVAATADVRFNITMFGGV